MTFYHLNMCDIIKSRQNKLEIHQFLFGVQGPLVCQALGWYLTTLHIAKSIMPNLFAVPCLSAVSHTVPSVFNAPSFVHKTYLQSSLTFQYLLPPPQLYPLLNS